MVILTEHEVLPGPSSSSSTHDLNHRYDVFLSFRGADTRNGFTDHLYNTLLDAGITTFLDDEEIETGEPLKPELESAIKSSRASIIILSENYASSRWCLDELVLILEQKRKFNQIVIPIFYHVEPTDVRKQQSSFMEAMAKHKERMDAETNEEKRSEWAQKMEIWERALTQVADLKGKVLNGRKETKLIEEVVTDIHRRLGVPLCHTLPCLTGRNYDIRFITSWLADVSCHTIDIFTIVGISGIGKTSLAKYVFSLHFRKFHRSSFIENINTRCKERHNGLLDLQKQLHGDISKKIELHVNDVSVYTSKIQNVLSRKRVFIVLDDIGSLDQLNALLGRNGLHPGSKIIITTKDSSLTERCALFKTQVHPKHTKVLLNGLDEYESLKILCIHAFESYTPKEGYKNVSKELAKYCDGHPLALEIMGASLNKRDVAYWEDFIKRLKKEPLYGLEKVKKALHMSFESLTSDNDKELFKHIACFFVGEDRDLTKTILEACDINTTSGITNLTEKCFLSLGWNNQLVMHSLIQEMGKDLVRQESPNKPGERSRLWCYEESFSVLKRKKGTKSILALALDMRMLDKKILCGSVELQSESLSQMDNVMLLQLNYVQLNECFENFPEELRWLSMNGFPLKSIHLDRPLEYLVCLDMSYSNIEVFDMSYSNAQRPARWQKKLVELCSNDKRLLGSLKILDLSFCEQLHRVGGFYELPALEKLKVRYCINLIEVCESIEHCVQLVDVDLSYCCKLTKLPISLCKLKKVQTLLLDGCNLGESAIINSSDTSINPQTSSSAIIVEAIPSDFKFFMTLLPSSLRILSLAKANLSNESFPMDLSCLAMLEELCLDENPIVSLPDCMRTLPRIEKLSIDHCYDLISVEHLPRTLRVFSVFTKDVCKIRKIKFDPEMLPLKLTGTPWVASHPSLEFEGMIKIQRMADVDEKLLHSLGWKRSDFVNEGHLETHDIWMVYEFGIFSTIYWCKGLPEWIRCRSEGPSISFIIPSSPKKLRGLNFCCVNGPPYNGECMAKPDIIIRNITKTQTWIYSYFIRIAGLEGKDCFSWLSHWMFGPNEMEAGDHIIIECYPKECEVGFAIVYDDDSVEVGEDVLSNYKSWNYIIGGDLSAFQATTGEYFLRNTIFLGDPVDKFYAPFMGYEYNYKEEEVTFKAFSQKKSETDGSQAQCSQMCPTAMAPTEAPCMPMFPHGLGQQTFDGQPPLQGQCLGGSRVGVPGEQNQQHTVPLMQQQHQLVPDMSPGQHEPHPCGSCVGVPQQQNNQQLVPVIQQQMVMGSVPYDFENAMHLRDAGGIFALTNASPTEQRTMTDENLYPLVDQLEAESEANVTRDFLHCYLCRWMCLSCGRCK